MPLSLFKNLLYSEGACRPVFLSCRSRFCDVLLKLTIHRALYSLNRYWSAIAVDGDHYNKSSSLKFRKGCIRTTVQQHL